MTWSMPEKRSLEHISHRKHAGRNYLQPRLNIPFMFTRVNQDYMQTILLISRAILQYFTSIYLPSKATFF